MALLTKAQYAKHKKVSRAAVTQKVKSGQISTITGPNGKEMIDPEVADREWKENTQHLKRQNSLGGLLKLVQAPEPNKPLESAPPAVKLPRRKSIDIDSVFESQKRQEAAKARMSEIKLMAMEGEYIAVKDAEKKFYEAAKRTVNNMLNISARLAAPIAAESDPKKTYAMIDEEIKRATRHLQEQIRELHIEQPQADH